MQFSHVRVPSQALRHCLWFPCGIKNARLGPPRQRPTLGLRDAPVPRRPGGAAPRPAVEGGAWALRVAAPDSPPLLQVRCVPSCLSGCPSRHYCGLAWPCLARWPGMLPSAGGSIEASTPWTACCVCLEARARKHSREARFEVRLRRFAGRVSCMGCVRAWVCAVRCVSTCTCVHVGLCVPVPVYTWASCTRTFTLGCAAGWGGSRVSFVPLCLCGRACLCLRGGVEDEGAGRTLPLLPLCSHPTLLSPLRNVCLDQELGVGRPLASASAPALLAWTGGRSC